MSVFSSNIQFKYVWRKYQKRVLDELSTHLEDDHLHIVAPPGSGKTVLGLEVMLRLGKPTLILAPTLAIRNQWIQRFCELFLNTHEIPDWISTDIRHPKLITVSTYQGLHAACNDSNEEDFLVDYAHHTDVVDKKRSNFKKVDSIINKLKDLSVGTLILDEAHHLKNEWWNTLSRVKEGFLPKIVGLTATPPYDVTLQEWSRFIQINGAIDAEITVPELVQEGDLCPHQDYVYLADLSVEEKVNIEAFRSKSEQIYKELISDVELIAAIESHPIILDPVSNEYYVYEHISFYSAALIFLLENNRAISEQHYHMFAVDAKEGELQLPKLDYKWFEELLGYYLFEEGGYFEQHHKEHRELLANKLKRRGILKRKTIRFEHNDYVAKQIASSINKLTAFEEIVNFEFKVLGHSLRQVILTDYVRKEYLTSEETNDLELKKIGVVSIFEKLRRSNTSAIQIGVLTGTLVILPQAALGTFRELLKTYNSTAQNICAIPLTYDFSYSVIQVTDQVRDNIVHIVTEIFQKGEIEVLIGTKALLGEGWDAPVINSLILASNIGSFVSSNQMRGRAIRTSPINPNKTSCIWHIASVDFSARYGGEDLNMIRRRFRNFVGIREEGALRIENGLDRLSLQYEDSIRSMNSITFERAAERDKLRQRWKEAIPLGTYLVEEIKIPFAENERYEYTMRAHMKKFINNMTSSLASSALFYLEWSTQIINKTSKILGVNGSYALLLIFGIGGLTFGGRAIRSFRYYTKYRDISKDIFHIGNALLKTLVKCKLFTTAFNEMNVLTFSDANGAVYCHLDGGTTYEKSTFVEMIQEIVNPVANPRYIIVRKSKVWKVFNQKDYHAVPEFLAKKSALANDFLMFWKEEVGDAELLFTKSYEGRKVLFLAKTKALANEFDENKEVQRVNIWR